MRARGARLLAIHKQTPQGRAVQKGFYPPPTRCASPQPAKASYKNKELAVQHIFRTSDGAGIAEV
eukprot:scaffold195071_cov19-Tisochrysis_lutea.AAC.1